MQHGFTGQPSDEKWPYGVLVRDKTGNLYGTTFYRGTANNKCTRSGSGLVYKIDLKGSETILPRVNVKSDPTGGWFPSTGLTIDSKGNLYGANFYGGDITCGYPAQGCCVVFELTP